MRTFLHVLGHLAAAGLQVANIALPILGGPEKIMVGGALAVIQGIAAVKARYKNPDGTPAKVAWVKQ